MSRCELHELEGCSYCNGTDRQHEQSLAEEFGMIGDVVYPLGTIPARYPGSCVGCGRRFGPDEPIRSDDLGGWVAGCCA